MFWSTSSIISLKIVRTVFVSSLFDLALPFDLASASAPTNSSQILRASSTILAQYFPFSQLHVAGFQT